MEHLSNDHKDLPNQHKNSHKLCDDALKSKAQNPKQHFKDKNIFFESQAAYHQITNS